MNLFDRLFSRAIICENGCWEYSGGRHTQGYGLIRNCGKQERAHRVAYDLVVDDIPDGMQVLHKCDNPPCINPDHLFLGTGQDNMDDMIAKGRKIVFMGEQLPQAKLTEDSVREIRKHIEADLLETNEIAHLYGVSAPTICDIKAKRTWKHVGDT